MKRFIIIFLSSLLITAGSYKLEGLIVSVVNNLVSSEISDFILDILNTIEEKDDAPSQPSTPQFPNPFESSPSPEPAPSPQPTSSPEATAEKICFYCDGSKKCSACDGYGIIFGNNFFSYTSGYGMDTLMDKVCYKCEGSGLCKYCA